MNNFFLEIAEVKTIQEPAEVRDILWKEFDKPRLQFLSDHSEQETSSKGFLVRATDEEPSVGFEVLATLQDGENGIFWDQFFAQEDSIPEFTDKTLLSDGEKVFLCERIN